MSHVTNIIVAFDLTTSELEDAIIARMNNLIPDNIGNQGVEHLNPTDCYGGSKRLEVNLAIGAFNYLAFDEWIEALKTQDWSVYDCWFIQVMVQGQDNDGFGCIMVWDDGTRTIPGHYNSPLDYPKP